MRGPTLAISVFLLAGFAMAQANPGPEIDQEVCRGIAEGGCIPPEPDSSPPNPKVEEKIPGPPAHPKGGEKIPAPRPKLEAGEKLRRRLPELKVGEKTPAPRPRKQAEPLRERQ